ncbi:uncharacterized protein LOC119277719 [Triticum dicoccoides]|uniref:F-box domain-containing protein n=1 Tax=Triticum turgidum subsp. durum TaxID=4567 RepID=A0A9R1S6P1_TRITD|nr:uncharacterized protein LOC119277719 [Triticum dicoccoides]VAH82193.1 unnamed protein product [Triticum turgidum subsp. durum]
MARRSRRRPSSPSTVTPPPLEDDDLLHEILLRLPPQPPYILRASLVSKRWRLLATDPKFLRRFRVRHRRPPLLGVFSSDYKRNISFRSTLDPPYRIPPERFSLPLEPWAMLDCRHGRVLFVEKKRHQLIVWDPITDHCCFVADPPLFKIGVLGGAVLCAAADQGHVHGDCRSSPFKVVVLGYAKHDDQEAGCVASVYYSETGIWGDLISTTLPWRPVACEYSTFVGNAVHWMLMSSGGLSEGILQFDLDQQRLAVINTPPDVHYEFHSVQVIQTEDGGLGFATLLGPHYHPRFQMWEGKVNSHGVAIWVLRRTVELQKILGLGFRIEKGMSSIVHYTEDAHAIFFWVHSFVYMVQLESMQSKKLFRSNGGFCTYRPFTSFYTEGISGLKQK